jgi:hypothetical protein
MKSGRRSLRWAALAGAASLIGWTAAPSGPSSTPVAPQTTAQTAPQTAPPVSAQSEADEYTRYELLDPATNQFHILYEVTATAPHATVYFNPIRPGSEATGESVFDVATGKRLAMSVVGGDVARKEGIPDAELSTHFIRIELPRPVPDPGGVRLLIEKTYKDPKSYYQDGADRIVFDRPLGIRRDSIVLPPHYELISCNVPSQVRTEANGRIVVSFFHPGPGSAALVLKARKVGK